MRILVFAAAAAFGLAVASLSCSPASGFRKEAFHHPTLGYSIHYTDAAKQAFLSSDWLIDNYTFNRDGMPASPKSGDEYRKKRELELLDGTTKTITVDLYDLRLFHKRTTAVIWVRTIPVGTRESDRELRVVAHDYAEGLSGTGFFATDVSRTPVASQQFATKVIDGHEARISGLAAYDATIEIANVDQLRLDAASRSAIVRVVFARTPYVIKTAAGGRYVDLPVLLMVGYVSNPKDFAAQLPDFDRFLALIDAGLGAPAGIAATPAASASAAPAPSPSPAPTDAPPSPASSSAPASPSL